MTRTSIIIQMMIAICGAKRKRDGARQKRLRIHSG